MVLRDSNGSHQASVSYRELHKRYETFVNADITQLQQSIEKSKSRTKMKTRMQWQSKNDIYKYFLNRKFDSSSVCLNEMDSMNSM